MGAGPTRNVHLGRWEIDRFCPAHNLAVELDGRPYHVSVRDGIAWDVYPRDRVRRVTGLPEG